MAKTQKTYDEKINDVIKGIEQLENQKKKLLQEKKDHESKERAHRLIQRGAILESLIDGAVTFTNDQIKSFLEKTITTEFARKILTQLKVQRIVESVAEQQVQPSESGGDTGGDTKVVSETPNES